jgi:hypothetical protein
MKGSSIAIGGAMAPGGQAPALLGKNWTTSN